MTEVALVPDSAPRPPAVILQLLEKLGVPCHIRPDHPALPAARKVQAALLEDAVGALLVLFPQSQLLDLNRLAELTGRKLTAVKPERMEEYRRRHAAVWPEMLQALKETGWHNYSLFLRPDGLLIGYVETPSIEAARAGMAATEVNARWQAEMAEFFEDLGDARPDTGFVQLREVFHLEEQLGRLDGTTTGK